MTPKPDPCPSDLGAVTMSRIFLIGYRGTGKSTVGQHLAALLDWQFVDSDGHLEVEQGRSIREIFATQGEPVFRDLESAVLVELAQREHCVIATGGGIILRSENRAVLKQSGFVAWLDGEPATIWNRLQADPTTADRRPNLTATGGLTEVMNIMQARQPLYAETASAMFPTEGRSPETVAVAILNAWQAASRDLPPANALG